MIIKDNGTFKSNAKTTNGKISIPTKEEIKKINAHVGGKFKIGADYSPDKQPNSSEYAPDPALPGCFRDRNNCLYVGCGGEMFRVNNPKTCRKRVITSYIRVTPSSLAAMTIASKIKPSRYSFKPMSLIVTGSFPAPVNGLDLNNIAISDISIGGTSQIPSSSEASSPQATAISGPQGIACSAFSFGAFNNLFDFDIATPSVAIDTTLGTGALLTTTSFTLSLSYFGVSWELTMLVAFSIRDWQQKPEKDKDVIYALVWCLAILNIPVVESGNYPSLYESGVIYKEETDAEDNKIELFRDIKDILHMGGSDCNNLCAWRIAELVVAGIPCDVKITWTGNEKEGFLYHTFIQLQNGVEDPSVMLGMGSG